MWQKGLKGIRRADGRTASGVARSLPTVTPLPPLHTHSHFFWETESRFLLWNLPLLHGGAYSSPNRLSQDSVNHERLEQHLELIQHWAVSSCYIDSWFLTFLNYYLCLIFLLTLNFPIQLTLHIHEFCIHGINKLWIKNIFFKTPESSKKHNLNLPHAEHYAESTRMKWCAGRPCCSLYVNISYMHILWYFIYGT